MADPLTDEGYFVLDLMNCAPTPDELTIQDCKIVALDSEVAALPANWHHLSTVAGRRYYLVPAEAAAGSRFPLEEWAIRRKRLTEQLSVPVGDATGIDTAVVGRERYQGPAGVKCEARLATALEIIDGQSSAGTPELADLLKWPGGIGGGALIRRLFPDADNGRPVKVAVVDFEFQDYEHLHPVPDILRAAPGLLDEAMPPPCQAPIGDGGSIHGTTLAVVVREVALRVQLGLFEAQDNDYYVGPSDFASALGCAVHWGAEVVVFAHSSSALWGTSDYLRDVLARVGGLPRPPLIVCSVGDFAKLGFQSVLPLDTIASQPQCMAVGCSDAHHRWLRDQHPSVRICSLGLDVELCSLGERAILPPIGANPSPVLNMSSLATPIVAGVATLALGRNGGLTLSELRRVLRATAETPDIVDIDPGPLLLPFRDFNEFDATGHNLKIGHGSVNGLAAWLAAGDPIAFALLATHSRRHDGPVSGYDLALRMAIGWEQCIEREKERSTFARAYVRHRPSLVRALIRSLELQDALYPLMRHLREIFARRAANEDHKMWFTGKALANLSPPQEMTVKDHSALVRLIEHIVHTLHHETRAGHVDECEGLLDWIGQLRRLLADHDSLTIKHFIARALSPYGLNWND